jgi:hypothetical protein
MNTQPIAKQKVSGKSILLLRKTRRAFQIARRWVRVYVLPSNYLLALPPMLSEDAFGREFLRIARLSKIGYQLKYMIGPVEICNVQSCSGKCFECEVPQESQKQSKKLGEGVSESQCERYSAYVRCFLISGSYLLVP